MRISSDDPDVAINIMEALADQSRRRILLLLQKNRNGVTASEIAGFVNKSVPTVLHHLSLLEKLGLVHNEMKPLYGREGDRKVKHWVLSEEKLEIEIDFSLIAFMPNEVIKKLFSTMKMEGREISADIINDENIENYLKAIDQELNDRQVKIVINALRKEFLHHINEWVDQSYDDSGKHLALNADEFKRYFSLENSFAISLFEQLQQTKKYTIASIGTCFKCGRILQPEFKFCPHCGGETTAIAGRLIKQK
ncbi:MAG: ArsR family transcriptional regulator [Candidatus Hodarchaeales archaeon]